MLFLMKLAIVTDTFPPDVNGVAMTLERLAAGMIGREHQRGSDPPRRQRLVRCGLAG